MGVKTAVHICALPPFVFAVIVIVHDHNIDLMRTLYGYDTS